MCFNCIHVCRDRYCDAILLVLIFIPAHDTHEGSKRKKNCLNTGRYIGNYSVSSRQDWKRWEMSLLSNEESLLPNMMMACRNRLMITKQR